MHKPSVGRRVVLAAVMLSVVVAAACGAPAAQPGPSEARAGRATVRPLVVATTTIIADMVRNVAGDRVVVKALLPPGADPHTFAPRPADMQNVFDASLVLYNGAGLEAWLDKLVRNAGGKGAVVVVSQGIPIRKMTEAGEGEDDPHFWFDVRNAMVFTRNIRDALVAMDPSGAETYRSGADAYLAQLDALDGWVQDRVKEVPADRRKLVTNHDQFGYFAARYEFEVIGTVLGATPGREPSAQEIAGLINTVKAAHVPAIFTENTVNSNLAARIAADSGIKVVDELYTDSLGPAGSGADTYIGLIRLDVDTIVKALR